MTTGKLHLFREELSRDLSIRIRNEDSEFQSDRQTRALPLRHLDPDVLDDENDDVDDYAARVLASSSLYSLFEIVIATAEMRAGSAVVRDVLVALAASRDGQSLAELVGGDDDYAISVMHVLAVLGNHLHTNHDRFSLTPVLRTAVERRYPLGKTATPRVSIRPLITVVERSVHRHPMMENA